MVEPGRTDRIENIPGFIGALEAAMKRAGVKSGAELSRRTRKAVAQNTISQWLNGDRPGRPGQVFAVERALGQPPGALSGYLGYLPAELYRISIETAIAVDDTIDDTIRQGLLNMLADFRARGGEGADPPKSAS